MIESRDIKHMACVERLKQLEEEKEIGMERKAHNYSLEYKNWRFTLTESERGDCFFVNIYYKDNSCSMYVHTGAKTAEEAKERVEDFIKTELK